MNAQGRASSGDDDDDPLSPEDRERLARHERELAADRRLTRLSGRLATPAARTAIVVTVLVAIFVVVIVTLIAISSSSS